MKGPLDHIAEWYSELNEYDSDHLAHCLSDLLEFQKDMLAGFLSTERLPLPKHLGRALAARAVIDWYIHTDPTDSATDYMLNLVETGDRLGKRLANEALSRYQQHQPDHERMRDTWFELRKEELSDHSLQAWERECLLRLPPPE